MERGCLNGCHLPVRRGVRRIGRSARHLRRNSAGPMPLISRTLRLPAIMLAVCLVALAVLSGPLFPFKPLPSDIADVVAKVPDVDLYLSRREAQHAEIKPGQAKAFFGTTPRHAARRRWRSSISTDSRPAEKTSRRSSRPWQAHSAPTPFLPGSPRTAARHRQNSPRSPRRTG